MDLNPSFEKMPEPQIVAAISTERNSLIRERHIWSFDAIESLLRRFSPSERLALYVLTMILGLSSGLLLIGLNYAISAEVPAPGGSYVEGSTGPARFINPVLALSQADQDLAMVIYSGLMRALPDGRYIPDLAESYAISADGTTYTFTLRRNATFHDGRPVTASDVLYTVSTAQNPDVKSPHRADWEGVEVTSPDPYTVVFKLPNAYAPFIENATLGILPKHLWQTVTPDSFPFSPLNTHPIGSGPYKVDDMRADASGAPTRFDLVPFDNFTLGAPFISQLSFVFFPTEDALVRAVALGQVDAVAGVTPSQLSAFKRDDLLLATAPLPRVFGIFFNQSHNVVLADAAARQALEESIDKRQIVESVLGGFGDTLESTIPAGILGLADPTEPHEFVMPESVVSASTTDRVALAQATLRKGGWSLSSTTNQWIKNKNPLTLKLATADEPELVATANAVASDWRKSGIEVEVQVYPLSDFNNTVLRPRNYDAILFGEVVSRSGDLFAFWHSSQRNDPGLNLSLYTNSRADTLLSKARSSANKTDRDAAYAEFAELIKKDRPAIFLYSPDFIYIVPTGVTNIQLGALTTPAERFLNVYQWYADTERVWGFFVNQ